MRWRDGIENPRGPVQKTHGRPGYNLKDDVG